MAEQVLTNGEDSPRVPTPDELIASVDFESLKSGQPAISDDVPETPEPDGGQSVDEGEKLARERGWVPQEDWRGKGEWRDFDTFNRIHETRTAEKDRKTLTREMAEMRRELADHAAFREQVLRERAEQEEARAQIKVSTLRAQLIQARQNGDDNEVERITDEILDIKVAAKTAPKPVAQQPKVDPSTMAVLKEFIDDNPIFKTDTEAQEEMAAQAKILREAGSNLQGREFLDRVKLRVQRQLPDKFTTRRSPQMAESGGSPTVPRGTKKSWGDLKPEVAAANERLIATTKGLTKDAILKNCRPEHFRR